MNIATFYVTRSIQYTTQHIAFTTLHTRTLIAIRQDCEIFIRCSFISSSLSSWFFSFGRIFFHCFSHGMSQNVNFWDRIKNKFSKLRIIHADNFDSLQGHSKLKRKEVQKSNNDYDGGNRIRNRRRCHCHCHSHDSTTTKIISYYS